MGAGNDFRVPARYFLYVMISRRYLLILLFLALISGPSPADQDLYAPEGGSVSAGADEESFRGVHTALVSDSPEKAGLIGRAETLASFSRWDEVINLIIGSDLNPAENETIRLLLAEGYAKCKKGEDALNLLDSHEGMPADEIRIRAEALVSLDREKEALSLLKRSDDLVQADPRLALITGTILSHQQNISDAIPYLEQAYAGLPGVPEAAAGLGTAIASEGLYEEALVYLEEATGYDPDDPDTWVTLAYLLNRVERYDQALNALEKAILLAPSDPDLLNAKAYTLYLAGRSGEARSIAEDALQKNPGDPAALDTLGAILLSEGDPRQALSYLKRAESSLPRDPEVLAHLGDAYRLLGQDTLAQDKYQRSLSLDPSLARAWKGYSAVLLSLGRYPEAAEAISEAYRFYPGDPDLIGWEKKADEILLEWYLKDESGKAGLS